MTRLDGKSLSYNVVPIVYGGADYRIFAPPQSHINVFHYDSLEEQAQYLKWLMKNPDMYKKYLLPVEEVLQDRARCAPSHLRFVQISSRGTGPRVYQSMFSEWFSQGQCPFQGFLHDQKYVTRAMFNNKN